MMDSEFKVILQPLTVEKIKIYSQILQKSPSDLVEEALQTYFSAVDTKLVQESLIDDNAQTNLGYDEFWEGVDL